MHQTATQVRIYSIEEYRECSWQLLALLQNPCCRSSHSLTSAEQKWLGPPGSGGSAQAGNTCRHGARRCPPQPSTTFCTFPWAEHRKWYPARSPAAGRGDELNRADATTLFAPGAIAVHGPEPRHRVHTMRGPLEEARQWSWAPCPSVRGAVYGDDTDLRAACRAPRRPAVRSARKGNRKWRTRGHARGRVHPGRKSRRARDDIQSVRAAWSRSARCVPRLAADAGKGRSAQAGMHGATAAAGVGAATGVVSGRAYVAASISDMAGLEGAPRASRGLLDRLLRIPIREPQPGFTNCIASACSRQIQSELAPSRCKSDDIRCAPWRYSAVPAAHGDRRCCISRCMVFGFGSMPRATYTLPACGSRPRLSTVHGLGRHRPAVQATQTSPENEVTADKLNHGTLSSRQPASQGSLHHARCATQANLPWCEPRFTEPRVCRSADR
jgi:hypothetical protein